jgi:hypothetical protein
MCERKTMWLAENKRLKAQTNRLLATCSWIWSRVKRRTQIVRETEKSDEGVKFRRSNQLGQRKMWFGQVTCNCASYGCPTILNLNKLRLLMSNDPHDMSPFASLKSHN